VGPDEIHVILLENIACAHQAPVNFFEEFTFENVELGHGYAANLGIQAIGAEGVAEAFARYCDGRDYEAMTS